ncbi:hypothetical protein [Pseudokineococcus marinus]|uniref:Uncharacterized protein n=1 Tax=Pseudokineococcus marinus TaxID=351215 RepID=A0A849BEY7_9ACTN|nr:hypothetical protein [Pseudokineococcus marinus]NNH21620.1 hypothetical protein [Pseudokineococcus marinus]
MAAAGVSGETALAVGAAMLAPAVEAVLARFDQVPREQQLAQAQTALALASAQAGVSVETVAQRMRVDGSTRALADETWRAAADAVVEAKIHVLARALAAGLREPASCDKHRLWAQAIARLEEPQLWLLETMDRDVPPRTGVSQDDEPADDPPGVWSPGQMSLALPELEEEVSLLLAGLLRDGLVDTLGGQSLLGHVGNPLFKISPAGQRLLRDLLDADESLPEP